MLTCIRSLRYATYQQFCWFVHARLGRGVRRLIHSCVVNAIWEKYPNENGQYTAFKDGEEASKIDFSWYGDGYVTRKEFRTQ